MEAVKQVLGVDVAKDELVVTLGRMLADFSIELYAHKVFKNKESGFVTLLEWLEKRTNEHTKVHVVMEATGIYHQKFAFYLYGKGYDLSIVLPNKISNYIRTLEVRTITDKTCSEAIARFGLERKLDPWKQPEKVYKSLQQLTRERDQIVDERSGVKNQLHAESHEAEPNERSLARLKARIQFLNGQEKDIKEDIDKILDNNEVVKKEVELITTIPGIGKLTAVIVLAETNGFELIRSKKQLASYAGLDVKEKQSGTSVKGKPRISKKGNRYLRKAMYLPALTAVKWDDTFRALYARIVAKQGIKMKGLVAVQRKLLETIYVIFKRKENYDKNYEENKQKNRAQIQIV
ncbi:IS110 family RNA-guided transposase [Flavobacterium subsaxonicum]|uniref:Transposase n=3 Tax=Flavobacterium TaxID=237 RepID=A0A0A2MDW2_9FLAO|nr:IS110 family transposase [Flavobacterium subsaxonicum]KGO90867.1 transposase [Flavobacterium subsaxonicum WB 4.1-42 = DSM 21790]